MSVGRTLLLGLALVSLVSKPAASEDGQDGNLSNKTLRLIPADLPWNITKLTLSHNLIRMSEEDIRTLRNYTQLTELYLDHNKISILLGHMLDGLSRLRTLSLSHNSIGRVEPRAFASLGALRRLDLSHNPVQALPAGVFASLAGAESLSLQRCGLRSLENQTLASLATLTSVDLGGNPWNCSCHFLHTIRTSGVKIASPGATCASPEDRKGSSLLDSSACLPKPTTAKPALTVKASSTQAANRLTPGPSSSAGSMNRAAPVPSGGASPEGNTWKFLVGVLVTALGTSTLLLFAIKAPSWYKLFFNYRHQRLREEEGPNIFTTSRYDTFSLAGEQAGTGAPGRVADTEMDVEMDNELDDEMDDEDGYIEDRYIETANYRAVEEA